MKKMNIVFMGTPEFAVAILDKLATDTAINIVGVITAPDKPAGRGRKIQSSDVKNYAVDKGFNILQPSNLKDEQFVDELRRLHADLFVVVAFRMLPEVVWSMPPLGTINLHASLLPQYRGAAPINWAIINGETETGVTTFFIEREIDTGALIEQRKTVISKTTTVGDLYSELMKLGAETTLSTVHKILSGDAQRISQEDVAVENELKPAPKIFKSDCEIDLSQNAETVSNFCRGLDPYPGAWLTVTTDKGERKTMKFFDVHRTNIRVDTNKVLSRNENGILLPCKDFYLSIGEIQLEGKRKMNFKEFIIGHEISGFHI